MVKLAMPETADAKTDGVWNQMEMVPQRPRWYGAEAGPGAGGGQEGVGTLGTSWPPLRPGRRALFRAAGYESPGQAM